MEIEQALAEPRFEGVPIGSTLGDLYTIELLNGLGNWSLRRQLTELLGLAYLSLAYLWRRERRTENSLPEA